MHGKMAMDAVSAQLTTQQQLEACRKANISIHKIRQVINGDAMDGKDATKFADAAGVSLATLGKRDL